MDYLWGKNSKIIHAFRSYDVYNMRALKLLRFFHDKKQDNIRKLLFSKYSRKHPRQQVFFLKPVLVSNNRAFLTKITFSKK